MNRKNLIEIVVTGAATVGLCGCASAPKPGPDHPESSSEVVARVAMNGCSDEYTNMSRAMARMLASTCEPDPECARGALATAQREARQAATDALVPERMRAAGAQVLDCE